MFSRDHEKKSQVRALDSRQDLIATQVSGLLRTYSKLDDATHCESRLTYRSCHITAIVHAGLPTEA